MTKAGRLSMDDMRNMINKRAGMSVAHNLKKENPTEVRDWIPTGSRWLDSIICKGKLAGIPVGKIVEIAGLEATGKSYMVRLNQWNSFWKLSKTSCQIMKIVCFSFGILSPLPLLFLTWKETLIHSLLWQ